MVFKRREKRTLWRTVVESVYPRGGWGRALSYIRHRLHRLPGSPESIARGIFAGVFAIFTPFFGLHFLVAAIVARVLNANILAALLATFLGNPLTYVPIGVVSLKTGHILLGEKFSAGHRLHLGEQFVGAADDLWNNFKAVFTDADTNWQRLDGFYHDVFFPYMIGGIIPGIIAGLIAYYLSVPFIRAYQKRRRGRLSAKLEELRRAKRGPKNGDA